ncbi:hypothetical protein LDP97_04175 [Aeromonas hydrophila]|nr:hypothetical protein LDP97_04175 [Aeromonas hydrophila]
MEHGGAPDVLTIRGKSADLRGSMNKLRERSWHQSTVGSIVEQVAATYQLAPCVGDSLKGQLIDHIDQANESDLAFLTRLAGQCDAISTVKSGRLMFIKAGQGTTAKGLPLPAITITRQDGDQHRFSVADRNAYTGVTAYWQDNKAAEKKKVEVKRKRKTKPKPERPLPPGVVVNKKENDLLVGSSENVKELRHVYANQANAMRAARALPGTTHHRQGVQATDRRGRLAAHPGGARPHQSGLHQPPAARGETRRTARVIP